MDKKSGTGRGKKDMAKGGHGKGNWGTDKADAGAAAAADDKEQTEATEAPAEATEEKVEVKEEKPAEPEIVYQEVGITLDDYLAQQQANSKGLLGQKANGRAHEKMSTKGIETIQEDKRRITTIDTKMSAKDTYAVKRNEGAELLAFRADDDDFGASAAAGGRGDRRGGRDDRGPRQPREKGGRGKRQGKIEITDDAFPAL